jgi:hypothetical protein
MNVKYVASCRIVHKMTGIPEYLYWRPEGEGVPKETARFIKRNTASCRRSKKKQTLATGSMSTYTSEQTVVELTCTYRNPDTEVDPRTKSRGSDNGKCTTGNLFFSFTGYIQGVYGLQRKVVSREYDKSKTALFG